MLYIEEGLNTILKFIQENVRASLDQAQKSLVDFSAFQDVSRLEMGIKMAGLRRYGSFSGKEAEKALCEWKSLVDGGI